MVTLPPDGPLVPHQGNKVCGGDPAPGEHLAVRQEGGGGGGRRTSPGTFRSRFTITEVLGDGIEFLSCIGNELRNIYMPFMNHPWVIFACRLRKLAQNKQMDLTLSLRFNVP